MQVRFQLANLLLKVETLRLLKVETLRLLKVEPLRLLKVETLRLLKVESLRLLKVETLRLLKVEPLRLLNHYTLLNYRELAITFNLQQSNFQQLCQRYSGIDIDKISNQQLVISN